MFRQVLWGGCPHCGCGFECGIRCNQLAGRTQAPTRTPPQGRAQPGPDVTGAVRPTFLGPRSSRQAAFHGLAAFVKLPSSPSHKFDSYRSISYCNNWPRQVFSVTSPCRVLMKEQGNEDAPKRFGWMTLRTRQDVMWRSYFALLRTGRSGAVWSWT